MSARSATIAMFFMIVVSVARGRRM
jgi:hypothetical protein